MNDTTRPSPPPSAPGAGVQPGKRQSEERNDPDVQPGARKGRQEPPYVHPEPSHGPGKG